MTSLNAFLDGAHVDPGVFDLRPDYRVLLLAMRGLSPVDSEALVAAAQDQVPDGPVEQLPHIAAWRDAYRAFGAKPQRTRNSAEALMRRPELPRVNPLTDIYNAVSVRYHLPIGGEDLDKYVGSPRLVRASGEEAFETTASGQPVVEHPEVGEVVWCDEAGVTCRRWNWRQTPRTALTESTSSALFILDALDPFTDADLQAAADELVGALRPAEQAARIIRAT